MSSGMGWRGGERSAGRPGEGLRAGGEASGGERDEGGGRLGRQARQGREVSN